MLLAATHYAAHRTAYAQACAWCDTGDYEAADRAFVLAAAHYAAFEAAL